MQTKVRPTGQERTFKKDEIIVSKTDMQGRITYTNSVFCRLSRMNNEELINQPHNIIRHPDMPSGLFSYLWDTIKNGEEIFAYVNNLAADGSNYWVLAHVTPTFDEANNITGYHSNRRAPSASGVKEIEQIYKEMRLAETKVSNKREASKISLQLFNEKLAKQNTSYPEFIWSVIKRNEI